MTNNKLTDFKKKLVLKSLKNSPQKTKLQDEENSTNPEELKLKSVELYEPITYKDLLKINKKKYRDLKIKILINHLEEAVKNTYYAIDLYKELKNKTEYWENESTIDFNFKDWNTIKKVNGKLTTYYKELLHIKQKLERGI